MDKLIKFLENNKSFPHEHRIQFLKKSYSGIDSPIERLASLYINSIFSPGQVRLKDKNLGVQRIYNAAAQENLNDSKYLSFKAFYNNLIGEQYNNEDELFNCFQSLIKKKQLPGLKLKTLALFLRDLYYLQSENDLSNLKIFNDTFPAKEKVATQIPVDNVIIYYYYCKIKKTHLLNYSERIFFLINNDFKQKYPYNFLRFEDIWFWGYFSTYSEKVSKNKRIRRICNGINKDKFYADISTSKFWSKNDFKQLQKKFKLFNSCF